MYVHEYGLDAREREREGEGMGEELKREEYAGRPVPGYVGNAPYGAENAQEYAGRCEPLALSAYAMDLGFSLPAYWTYAACYLPPMLSVYGTGLLWCYAVLGLASVWSYAGGPTHH
eukprot:915367-Rhodomonas_salina.3